MTMQSSWTRSNINRELKDLIRAIRIDAQLSTYPKATGDIDDLDDNPLALEILCGKQIHRGDQVAELVTRHKAFVAYKQKYGAHAWLTSGPRGHHIIVVEFPPRI